jgi:hypothetical protein
MRDFVCDALLLSEQERLTIAEGLELAGTLTEETTQFKPKAPKGELGARGSDATTRSSPWH